MTSQARILVADDDPVLRNLLQGALQSSGFDVLVANNGDELVRMAQEHAPNLLLIDLVMPLMDGYEAIRQLRNDTRTAHLPMIILTARDSSDDVVTGFETGADDYIIKPYDIDVLLARVRSHLRRAAQRPVHNPLTGLPGNTLLQAELSHRLGNSQEFALLYVDLDNFKAFNDAYGFARGDRAIHLLADVLTEVTSAKDFVGHIGGDDFAVIHIDTDVELLCQSIIATFDQRVGALYDQEDLERGYLLGFDRQGVYRRFGLLSLSIAVIHTRWRRFHSVEEISQIAAGLKTKAKLVPTSSYAIDRRRQQSTPLRRDRRGQRTAPVLLIGLRKQLRTSLTQSLRAAGYHPLTAIDIVAAHTLLTRTSHPVLLLADAALGEPLWELWQQFDDPPPLIAVALTNAQAEAARAAGVSICVQATTAIDQTVALIMRHVAELQLLF